MITKTITLPNGKRKYVRGKTEAEAKAKIAEIRRQISAGVDVTQNPTFAEFYGEWFDLYRRPELRPGTIKDFEGSFANHVLPYLGNMRVRDIKPVHVQKIFSQSELCHEKQMTLRSRLASVFESAVENGMLMRSPVTSTLKIGGAKRKKQDALTPTQSETLTEAVQGTKAYGFVLLCLHTGMRRSEALGLRKSDVDFSRGVIHVRSQRAQREDGTWWDAPLKTDAAERDIPMSDTLARWLWDNRLTTPSEYVISKPDGAPYNPSSINSLWQYVTNRQASHVTDKPRGTQLDRPIDFEVHPHTLRYTFATRLFEAGVDIKTVQYLMGHAKPEETLAIYVKYCEQSRIEQTADIVRSVLA